VATGDFVDRVTGDGDLVDRIGEGDFDDRCGVFVGIVTTGTGGTMGADGITGTDGAIGTTTGEVADGAGAVVVLGDFVAAKGQI
jgi:hypothetical protein